MLTIVDGRVVKWQALRVQDAEGFVRSHADDSVFGIFSQQHILTVTASVRIRAERVVKRFYFIWACEVSHAVEVQLAVDHRELESLRKVLQALLAPRLDGRSLGIRGLRAVRITGLVFGGRCCFLLLEFDQLLGGQLFTCLKTVLPQRIFLRDDRLLLSQKLHKFCVEHFCNLTFVSLGKSKLFQNMVFVHEIQLRV